MDGYTITGFILGCIIGLALYYIRKKIKKNNDSTVERIEVIEKDIEVEARFFASVVYKSGRVEMITPKALTEAELYKLVEQYQHQNQGTS